MSEDGGNPDSPEDDVQQDLREQKEQCVLHARSNPFRFLTMFNHYSYSFEFTMIILIPVTVEC